MRKPSIILLLSLMLIPLLWNGASLMHYLVEHTHTFCASEQDHQHTTTEQCQTICHFSAQHHPSQLPQEAIDFQKLKLYVAPILFFKSQFSFFNPTATRADYRLLYGRMLSDNIFRPPIS